MRKQIGELSSQNQRLSTRVQSLLALKSQLEESIVELNDQVATKEPPGLQFESDARNSQLRKVQTENIKLREEKHAILQVVRGSNTNVPKCMEGDLRSMIVTMGDELVSLREMCETQPEISRRETFKLREELDRREEQLAESIEQCNRLRKDSLHVLEDLKKEREAKDELKRQLISKEYGRNDKTMESSTKHRVKLGTVTNSSAEDNHHFIEDTGEDLTMEIAAIKKFPKPSSISSNPAEHRRPSQPSTSTKAVDKENITSLEMPPPQSLVDAINAPITGSTDDSAQCAQS